MKDSPFRYLFLIVHFWNLLFMSENILSALDKKTLWILVFPFLYSIVSSPATLILFTFSSIWLGRFTFTYIRDWQENQLLLLNFLHDHLSFHLRNNRYSRDNRFNMYKSSYSFFYLAPRCRLQTPVTSSFVVIRLGCSPRNVWLELGSERCKSGWSISIKFNPSKRGPD